MSQLLETGYLSSLKSENNRILLNININSKFLAVWYCIALYSRLLDFKAAIHNIFLFNAISLYLNIKYQWSLKFIIYIDRDIDIYYMAHRDEHTIRCSECGRGLIVKDTVNNGVAFLSHLKLDTVGYLHMCMERLKFSPILLLQWEK